MLNSLGQASNMDRYVRDKGDEQNQGLYARSKV